MSEYIVCPYCHNPLSQGEYVKAIRCCDCRHYHSYQDLCERLKPGMVVMGSGYCAWGERRDA